MATATSILVGTVGQGIMRSPDGGETWQRAGVNQGIYQNAMVRALKRHPSNTEVVFAGADRGLFRSDDGGQHWTPVDCALNGKAVFALSIDPSQPDLMYAGTGTPDPVEFYRSSDGGATWEQRPMEVAKECPIGLPLTTAIAIDPTNPKSIWFGIEVDGLRHSADGGDTWEKAGTDIPNLDIHNVAVTAGPPKTVIVVVNNDVWTTTDEGASWRQVGIREVFPYTYPRGIIVHPDDPRTVFITIGDTTPGQTGAVMKSTDAGQTWEAMSLSTPPNSAMWVVDILPSEPDSAVAGSRYGHLYRSDDRGGSWSKLSREFSEIAAVLSVPA